MLIFHFVCDDCNFNKHCQHIKNGLQKRMSVRYFVNILAMLSYFSLTHLSIY